MGLGLRVKDREKTMAVTTSGKVQAGAGDPGVEARVSAQ